MSSCFSIRPYWLLSAQQHIRHLRFFNGNNVLDGSFGYVGTSWPSGWQDNGGSSSRVSNIENLIWVFLAYKLY